MKIEKISSNTSTVSKVNSKNQVPDLTFSNMMNEKHDKKKKEELEELLDDIKEKGETLIDSKNLELLLSYKKTVKTFIKEASEFAFKIVDRKGLSRVGRSKILKIVSLVDENLMNITDVFLKDEKQKLGLLDKIGELLGLLSDFYV